MKEIKIKKTILNETSDILSAFFKEINNYPLLTPEEEKELAYKVLEGNEKARDKLIISNLRFVITCAKQYVNQGVPLIDLIQAGEYGLIQACDKFDPSRGYKFISFAVWYIRREILKEIYNTGRTVRYPVTFISNITKVKRAYDKFISKNEREPSDKELLELTNLTQNQYDKVILNKSYCSSLDTPVYEDTTLQDIIPDSSESLDEMFKTEALLMYINKLNERERKIIKESFGIGCPQKKIKEIAEEMNLGSERVRQLRKSGIEKLSKYKNVLKVFL